ncbi:MAG: discoidin domain-containing protein [Planctomycetaceae bacterium]|jgi:hypothetical protein|nr:discoidin domain-containing protein [Planctomycetaceae bacterium]
MYRKSDCFNALMTLLTTVSLFGVCPAVCRAAAPVEVLITADSEQNGYEPYQAMDGNAKTMWHSRFTGTPAKLPQTLTIDLKKSYPLKGLVITPRNDNSENGDIKNYEIFIRDEWSNAAANHLNDTQAAVAKGELPKGKSPKRIDFAEPVTGRYLVLKVLSEHSGNQFASAAEIEVLCDKAQFAAKKAGKAEIERERLLAELGDAAATADAEYADEYLRLVRDIQNKARFDKIADETFNKESLILNGDRDPLDTVLRRTKALIDDLRADRFNRNFNELCDAAADIPVTEKQKRFAQYLKVCELRRQAAFSNPLLKNFKELLFVKKHRGTYNHMCDQYYGINLPSGGGVFVLKMEPEAFAAGKVPEVRNLLENAVVESGRLAGQKLTTGSFLSPDISFDARKLAFAYVECQGDTKQRFHTDPSKGHWHEGRSFHIFTCGIDGSGLKQITDGTWNDFDPCWLPNDRMAFITERRGGYLRCGRECPTYTLFDMNPDGSQIRCLSYHETNEWQPTVTHEGRILYTRWDYPDRWGCIAHHPWVTSLDGRDSRHVHGNFSPRTKRADMELDCRMVPDSPKFAATAAPHHGQAYGSLVLVDPRVKDDDVMAPVKRLTPDVDFPESQGGEQIYGAPYPLSENYYLAVADFALNKETGVEWRNKQYYRGGYGIYLVDAFGNKELIYRDPEIGCNSPIPVMPRPTPPAPPQQISADIEPQPYVATMRDKIDTLPQGTLSIVNVYESLRPLPAGTKLKELRVLQLIPMSVPSGRPPHETGFREPSAGDSVPLARYVLGTVPIEEDGSVHLTVPPRRELMLQVLDADGLAVQSMRSSLYLHDGEQLSCNGCHEQQMSAPLRLTSMPKAFQREPSKLKPDHPDSNPFSYPRLVQPVLEKHCVACHSEERSKGTANVPNLAKEPIKNHWYASFNELVPKYGFYSYGEPLRTAPGKFGARASKLYAVLKKGHYDVNLTPEEMHRITLWLDCVSVFYGVYEKDGGEAQLRGEVVYPTLE